MNRKKIYMQTLKTTLEIVGRAAKDVNLELSTIQKKYRD